MHDRSMWTRGTRGTHVAGNGKVYNNLTEFSRPCYTCSQMFSIYVTDRIADGLADSNSFALRNCPMHRQRGRRTTEAANPGSDAMVQNTMKEELTGLYGQVAELKSRLATYELQGAMNNMQVCEPVQNTRPSEFPNRMPWE